MTKYGFNEASWEAAKAEGKTALADCARANKMITYSEFIKHIRSISFETANDPRLACFLGEISREEALAGRGMSTALVVHKHGDHKPGPGFFELAESLGNDVSDIEKFWIDEVKKVFTSWQTPGDAHAILRKMSVNTHGLAEAKVSNSTGILSRSETCSSPPALIETFAIARALLRYGGELKPASQPIFTKDPEANRFIMTNAFAFLLGVIFNQGIPYERAWLAPLELSRRLGHLDPDRMMKGPKEVGAAIARAPKLHRFITKLPEWVVNAARIVCEDYGGNAEAIWSDKPTAKELQNRFQNFAGVGQKKAAMDVDILERHFKISIRAMEGNDVAYDIHIRRVFLRTGLAERDDREHMIQVARQLNPERPAALDDPAWRIGMEWCHSKNPACNSCPITIVCPKLIERADSVKGN